MAIDARTKQLIEQKAKSGVALSDPTPEKQAYYNQVVKPTTPTPPKTSAPTYTTMNTPQTTINSHTTQLIKDKAAQGIKLDYATPEKQKIYDDYQNRLTGLIEQKASNGQQLDVSNQWKQSIYDNKTQEIQNNIKNLVENGQRLNNANPYQQGLYDKYNFDFTTDRMTSAVNSEIEAQVKAYQNQLAMQQQSNDLAVNQNNAFLTEQLGKLKQNQAVDTDKTIALQNRRGNFYSGGTDYQLGQVNRGYSEAQGGLQRDVAMRNADIYAKNSMLANQVSQQISQLQQSAPGLIRERVLQELDRQRGIQMDEAKLTGTYNGAPTLENQQWQSEFGLKQGEFGLKQQGQQFDQQFQLQQFAYKKLRDSIEDKRWQQQFDQDVNQFGLNYGLQRQIQLGNLSVDQARLALSQQEFGLSQDKFVFDQQQASTPKQSQVDLNKYTSQLNKQFTAKDEDTGQYKVTNEDGLYRAIIGMGLDDQSTIQLLSMYGFDVSGFLNQ